MRSFVLLTLVTIMLLVLQGVPCRIEGQEKQRQKAPPLSLEGLLDEKLPEASQKPKILADNQSCYVCHANYQEEELVVVHGKEDVSCMDCHGKSEDHRNDEDNITPPDKMYALADIDDMCSNCHDTHDVSAQDVLARWQKRCPQKTNPATVACTDCHFYHRLALRSVQWNKQTGQLLLHKKEPASK